MDRQTYAAELRKLQEGVARMQRWVQHAGLRVVIVFEGRDTAGKGGVIKALTERSSARVFRVVALPKPDDRERTQLYLQRYVAQLPAAGEIVLFDRSWYNRAGVEPVMGFCTEEEHTEFLRVVPRFEEHLVRSGIVLIKYWLEVTHQQQLKRLRDRTKDPVKQWKLSDLDFEGHRRWFAYSRARDRMFAATDTKVAPWSIVSANDQRVARLNCISHLLQTVPCEHMEVPPAGPLPLRDKSDAYDDRASLKGRHFVPDEY